MKRFKNILCVIEPDERSAPALQRAVSLAQTNQASLTVASVIPRMSAGINMPDGGPISAELQAALVQAHTRGLESLAAARTMPPASKITVLVGTTFLEIVREVLRSDHDLVVKIPESLDWLDHLLGSDDMHLLRKCPAPVWLIKPQASKTYRRILAAVDVDDSCPPAEYAAKAAMNREILELAASLALADFAELHVVHVWDAAGEMIMRGPFMDTPESRILSYVESVREHHATSLDRLIDEVISPLGTATLNYLKPQTHLIKGVARKEIPSFARHIEADLLVMGTVARTGIHGFIMGNTAESILNQIDCSVLAIKPPGFVTPVRLQD